MSRQNDKEKSFPEKFKQFFKSFNKGGAGISRSRSDESIVLTDELVSELGPESPIAARIKAIREFTELSKCRKLESYTVEKLWALLCDLLLPKVPKETRHLVLGLFENLCKSQLDQNGFLRAKFFAVIQAHDIPEDTSPRFDFLKALTGNGKDMNYFDEKMGPFILSWMPNTQNESVSIKDFMGFLVNVVKFNQSFLDSDILNAIIQNVCFMCCTYTVKEDVLECLHVLSAVVCYPSLPPGSLSTFLATLCRTVNVEPLCQPSWKIMRDLLGTHLGYSGLSTMCQFMETADRSEDVAVIRGAVFYVGVALWGNRVVRSLKCTPSTVLTSFCKALQRKHPLVSYEVIMRVQDLVKNQGNSLPSVSWDLILTIVDLVVENRASQGAGHSQKIVRAVNETLDTIEIAMDAGHFSGSVERFYAVTDACVRFRSEPSVEKLLRFKAHHYLRPTKSAWLNNLVNFSERHYRLETRPGVKVKALSHISNVCISNRDTQEEELIDKIVLPYLRPLETENDSWVRQQGVKFIVDFMMVSSSKKGHDLLHILERILNRPFEVGAGTDVVHIFSESEVVDACTAVQGIIKIFQKRIYYLPSSIAITAYKIIVRHLANHYKRPATLDQCQSIRYMIFECFFKIRANSLYHLGFPDPVTGIATEFSPYLAVDHRDGEVSESGAPKLGPQSIDNAGASYAGGAILPSSQFLPYSPRGPGQFNAAALPTVTFLSLYSACQQVVASLRKEKDWKVLEIVLKQVPTIMENKTLILSKHGNDIDYLANSICGMMMDKSIGYPESLRNTPPKFQKSDFQVYLFPILAALISYHAHLEPSVQLKIVKCLEFGLVSKSSRMCILSLSTCILEMKDTMHKLLPPVLLSLSKISPKVTIAIPVLEFLSTLIHLPRVFASFVQDQYMSIFAIALPYTNPFKFSQYTVSLAHHVIAMWFLKCRLSFRRGFVSYIIKGLKQNVWAPFDEDIRRSALELQNEDSSNRKRSSSLTEQSQKRRERAVSGHTGAQMPAIVAARGSQSQRTTDLEPAVKKAMKIFHEELTETCVDLLARYAFSDCSALPTRFPCSDFLLQGGHSQTWLMDNKIITVTTSGCTQKELREGLCDKCWMLCRSSPLNGHENSGSTDGEFSLTTENGSPDSALRRRHHSAFAGSQKQADGSNENQSSSDTPKSPTAKDDLHLEHKIQLPVRRLSVSGVDGSGLQSTSPGGSVFSQGGMLSDWALKQKSDHMLCTCWCQGWAEIHVRRPTGNTSWMMRIQNQLGNSAASDLPLKELTAIYIRTLGSTQLKPTEPEPEKTEPNNTPPVFSPVNSGPSSPSLRRSLSVSDSREGDEHTSQLPKDSSSASPKSPIKSSTASSCPKPIPSSPVDTGSPTQLSPSKNPVRRSNSSPEMSDTWKNPFTKQHEQIQEQDEDEINSSTSSVQKFQSSEETTPEAVEKKQARFADPEVTATFSERPISTKLATGSTPPTKRGYSGMPGDGRNLDGRPPQVPPRQRTDSEKEKDETLGPLHRDRTATISVMTPAIRNKGGLRRFLSTGNETFMRRDFPEHRSGSETSIRSGMSPSFIFLQLCAQGVFGQGTKPLLLAPTAPNEKSLRVLDYIPPYETHKIGVLYVGLGQSTDETAILQNNYGSTRYREFLEGLGSLIKLREVDPQKTYIGGLGRDGADGEFAYIWQDDVMQVIFHVATLMPTKKTDPSGNEKKRHIGNDYVAIVYNNSEQEFDISTIKGQFLYACVVIHPLDHRTNRVIVKAKPVLSDHIGHTEAKIVSDQNLPVMARQLALHSNLASVIFQQRDRPDPYASNWLERLRNIKRLRNRLNQELGAAPNSDEGSEFSSAATSQSSRPTFSVDDFTDFV